jgi:hypothetical protein
MHRRVAIGASLMSTRFHAFTLGGPRGKRSNNLARSTDIFFIILLSNCMFWREGIKNRKTGQGIKVLQEINHSPSNFNGFCSRSQLKV